MKIDELDKRLDNEFSSVYKTVLVDGDWGIGKTYLIKNKYKENKNKYTKAIISGKGAGLKNQKFDLHAKYFSYPITINKSHVEAGKRIEYSLEELTDQFSYGLYNAYQSNYNLIVALADREDNVY